jgi:hypothetical protein
LFDLAVGASAGYWQGERVSVADWQSASVQDASSIEGDPLFVSIAGADGVMGVLDGVDRGRDDNLQVLAGSPTIDAGDLWNAPLTDFFGRERVDDQGTTNTGASVYNETQQAESDWEEVGDAMNWRHHNSSWNLSFANDFIFPFAGTDWTTVRVSDNGLLQFGSTTNVTDTTNTTEELMQYTRIAPLWDNLRTDLSGDDIFVNQSIEDEVTIRWDASRYSSGHDVNFAVTLYSDGRVAFHYGSGNEWLSPTVGLSQGDDGYSYMSMYDGLSDLGDLPTVEFGFASGYADIGAYEFTGDSDDETPPTILGTTPSGVHDQTEVGFTNTMIEISFSEELDVIEAVAVGNYDLRNSGENGFFGDADDIVLTLVPVYEIGETTVTLEIADQFVDGEYRLTIYGSDGRSLRDLAGNKLDGDGDGVAGGDYQRIFSIDALGPAGELVNPVQGAVLTSDPGSVDIRWSDEDSGIDVDSIGIDDIMINDGEVDIDYVQDLGEGVYRYVYNNDGEVLGEGWVSVVAVAGGVEDLSGNTILVDTLIGDFILDYDLEGPAISNVTLNGGIDQRSNMSIIEITFDEATNIDTLISNGSIVNAVQLARTTHEGGTVKLSAAHFSWNKATNTLTIDLTSDGFGGSGETILTDARYELQIDTTMITDGTGNAMEDSDGTPDGVLAIDRSTGSSTQDLFRLAGDANGDAVVNEIDLAILQAAYLFDQNSNDWDPNADLNGDGKIDIFDAWLLALSYGNTL